MLVAALSFLLMTGQVTDYLMGRRRYRDGQSTHYDDPGRQGMHAGSVVAGLPIIGCRGCDIDMPSVIIMPMRLVVVLRLIVVKLFGLMTISAPPVGHGRSTEKCQSYCHNDNRFK
jgi:hypothetical protein